MPDDVLAGLAPAPGGLLLLIERGRDEVAADVLRSAAPSAQHIRARAGDPARALDLLTGAADDVSAGPVAADCLHALYCAGSANADAGDAGDLLMRVGRSGPGAAAVVPAGSPALTGRLVRAADSVLVVDGLPSGAAEDVHAVIVVAKKGGRWVRGAAVKRVRVRVGRDGRVVVVG